MKKRLSLVIGTLFVFGIVLATADTPPPSTVTAKIKDSAGNSLLSTSGALNVNVTNPGGGTQTVNQGSAGTSEQAWYAQITNFPSIQPVSQSGSWSFTSLNPSTNYSLESGGHLASIDTKTPSLVGGAVPITGSITTSPAPPSDTVASGPMASSGAVVSVSANGIADGAVNIVGSFVGSINIQCVPYGTTPVSNLSTLQSGLWSSSAITTPGYYKWRGGNGCINVQAAYSAYTSGSPTVYMAANQAVGNPTVSQPNAANLNATVIQSTGTNLHTVVDSGSVTDNLTQVGGVAVSAATVNGVNRIPVYLGSGVQPTTTAPNWMDVIGGVDGSGKAQTLSITASQALKVDGSAVTQPVSGTVTANQGGAPWANNLTQVGGVSVTAASVNGTNRIPVYLASGAAPNTTAPTWMDVMGGIDGTGKAQAFSMTATQALKVDNSGVTQPISGSVTANLGTLNGAATAANQTGGSQKTQVVDGSGNVFGPAQIFSSINYMPVDTATAGTPGIAISSSNASQADLIGGTDGTTLRALSTDSSGRPNINILSSVLPIGASTSANQTTELGYLSTIATNTGAQNTDITTTGTITALNGAVSISGQGVYTASFSVTGTWSATLVIEGQTPDSNWTALPINTISNALPYMQSMAITTNGTYAISAGGFTSLRIRASAYTSGAAAIAIDGSLAQQTVIANINTPDLTITGASAQTAVVNNILNSTFGTAATFVGGLHSASVQVTSTGTGGTFIFEGSNDNVNYQAIPVYNQLILTGTPITAAITASASQFLYTFPIQTNYVRLRIATAITGGSIQAFSRFSQAAWSPTVVQIANATAANANVQATIASGTVTSVASSSQALNTTVNDLASVAKTATFQLVITPAAGGAQSMSFQLNNGTTSGTTPTLDCQVIESLDNGATYTKLIYQFERVTGSLATPLVSPLIRMSGNKFEYNCIIGGTTPSFTMALWRVGSPLNASTYRDLYDRTMVPSTLSSAGSVWSTAGCTSGQLTYSQSAATTNPTITLQTSPDQTNWANTTYNIATSGAGTFTVMIPAMNAKYARTITSTAGSGVTYNYSEFTCTGP